MDDFTQPTFTTKVLQRIKEHRQQLGGGFQDPSQLKESDLPLLLCITLSTLSLPSLNSDACWDHLLNHFYLILDLQLSYISNDFSLLENHASFICFRRRPKNADAVIGPIPMRATGSNGSENLQDAFHETYIGDLPELLKETLDEYGDSVMGMEASNRPYNRSAPIVQSSGMGKSRLARETARLLFTIPINLREALPSSVETYPPADDIVREYFVVQQTKSDELLQVEYAIFLIALFDLVASLAREISKRYTTSRGAKLWAEYLEEGQTPKKAGARRMVLYDTVVTNAWNMSAKVGSITRILPKDKNAPNARKSIRMLDLDPSEDVETYFGKLSQSCLRFCNAVRPALGGQEQVGNTAMVYFDEAHTLTDFPSEPGPLRRMSPYHNLGKVLAVLVTNPVFFMFLSTNSNLQQLAPAPYDHPSLRVSKGSIVFPPFTELPFDVFDKAAFEMLARAREEPTLKNVCTIRVMAYFGRPMWYVHHRLWRDQNRERDPKEPPPQGLINDVITFAVDKISAHGKPEKSAASNLACVGIRVGINFSSDTRSSRQMEANHVESHMRVVVAIPAHREYMRTGSPSEPILAEAAARKLERFDGKIVEAGPRILADNCQDGFLARGERGELCGRLLLTIAHDIAIEGLPRVLSADIPKYHRPIPVLAFLCALFATPHHNIIRNATPMCSAVSPSGPSEALTLANAFRNAFVSFSHFEIAQDSEVLDASQLPYSLIRGFAIQAKDNQYSIDAVIPIHMGNVTDPITPKTTSAINLQFKNRKNARSCSVDRSITVPDVHLPVISIVFELGEENPPSPLVLVRGPSDQEVSNQVNHYSLVARGHGPETFNAVTTQSKPSYNTILGTKGVLDDYPRAHKQGLVKYVEKTMLLRHDHTADRLALLSSSRPPVIRMYRGDDSHMTWVTD